MFGMIVYALVVGLSQDKGMTPWFSEGIFLQDGEYSSSYPGDTKK